MTKFDGSGAGEVEVDLKVAKSGAYILHRKVVAEQANMRLGTASTKTRSMVRGGGRKPYQQKGTGRARRGSSRSPLLKGGGVTFGPQPKSYAIKMNKKEKRLAISTALMSALPKMTAVEDLDGYFTQPRTKDMRAFLERQSVDTANLQSTLLITSGRHENTALSARNLPYLNLMHMENINVRDILKAKKVLVASSALEAIKERYGA
jgi:large subunit ribosomal protein L4